MLGWFSTKCPVNEESRAWVERRMAWVAAVFGAERMRQAEVTLPTPEYFPDEFDGSLEAGERLFERVCGYVGVERSRVRLAWFRSVAGDQDQMISIKADGGGAAGTY